MNAHTMNSKTIIARAVKEAGGMRALAEGLGINYQSIQSWTRIPSERLVAVEGITGIPREELRPDLFVASRPRRRP